MCRGGRYTNAQTHVPDPAHPHPGPPSLGLFEAASLPFASLCLDYCSACTAVYSGDHEIMTGPFSAGRKLVRKGGNEASRACGYMCCGQEYENACWFRRMNLLRRSLTLS